MSRVNSDTIDLVERIARYYSRRSPCEQEDLVQACWVDLLRYSDSPAFLTCKNAILHQCRRERRWRRHESLEPPHPKDVISDEVIDIPWYLSHLSPRQRQVIELTYWGGLSLKEIAAHCGISWKVVAVTRANAMRKMRAVASPNF